MPSETIEMNGSRTNCSFGLVNREMIRETQRRTTDLENKFWAILLFSFSSLVGIVLNIVLTMGKH